MEIDPSTIDDAARHRIVIGCVTPRPIAFVSSISPDGRPNLAPFSFFTATGSTPMTLVFCPGPKGDGSPKDTLRNVLPKDQGGVGELVVNLAVESIAREVAVTAESLPYGESEIDLARLTAAPSRRVTPPRIVESPVSFECVTSHAIPVEPSDPATPYIIAARVVHIWMRDDLVDARFRVDQAKLATIGRMGGIEYCLTRERFPMPRGRAALDAPLPFTPGGTRS